MEPAAKTSGPETLSVPIAAAEPGASVPPVRTLTPATVPLPSNVPPALTVVTPAMLPSASRTPVLPIDTEVVTRSVGASVRPPTTLPK